MRTVLLITARFDPAADLLLTELRRRDVPCVRWNTYKFPLESTLTYRAANDGFAGEIVSDGRVVDLDTVGSVRMPGVISFTPPARDPVER
jgi:hypothetical protein